MVMRSFFFYPDILFDNFIFCNFLFIAFYCPISFWCISFLFWFNPLFYCIVLCFHYIFPFFLYFYSFLFLPIFCLTSCRQSYFFFVFSVLAWIFSIYFWIFLFAFFFIFFWHIITIISFSSFTRLPFPYICLLLFALYNFPFFFSANFSSKMRLIFFCVLSFH